MIPVPYISYVCICTYVHGFYTNESRPLYIFFSFLLPHVTMEILTVLRRADSIRSMDFSRFPFTWDRNFLCTMYIHTIFNVFDDIYQYNNTLLLILEIFPILESFSKKVIKISRWSFLLFLRCNNISIIPNIFLIKEWNTYVDNIIWYMIYEYVCFYKLTTFL